MTLRTLKENRYWNRTELELKVNKKSEIKLNDLNQPEGILRESED